MSAFKEAPAPWKLKGTSWVFTLSGLADNNLPPGFAAPYQADAMRHGGEFTGGLGTVQLVSYTESPVGPYDELAYIPGRWAYEHNDPAFRITRIYVSSKESTFHGRRNWNVPKQVANFSYRAGPDSTILFDVYMPTDLTTNSISSKPFFSASIKPLLGIPLLSSLPLPFSTSLLGKFFSFMQPPLPPNPNIAGHPEEVGTDKWAALTSTLTGTMNVVGVVPGFQDGSVGDGVGFPKVKPLAVGAVIRDLELGLPAANWYGSV